MAVAWRGVEAHSNAVARRCEGKARQGDGEAGQSDEKARRGGGKAKKCKASEWNRPAEVQQRLARAKLRKDGNGKARHRLAMAKHCPEREWKCEPITSNEEGYGRRKAL